MQNTSGSRTGYIDVFGTSLYYEELGEGPALVLIHGGYMDRRMWDDQFAIFAVHFHVIRYDIRGFGESPLPPVPYTDREDLYQLLAHLHIGRATLLGLSLGGTIAVECTLEHPNMVNSLILVGTPVPGYPLQQLLTQDELQATRQRQAPFTAAVRERDVSGMVEALMAHPTLVPPLSCPEARERVRRNLSAYSFTWVLNNVEQEPITPPAHERLAEVTVPTLLVLGADDDIILHRSADIFEREIPAVQRVSISGTHHMPNMEKPDQFNQIILHFLMAHALSS